MDRGLQDVSPCSIHGSVRTSPHLTHHGAHALLISVSRHQGFDCEKRRRTLSSTKKRTEANTSPSLHQVVHLSGSELVHLLDLSSSLKGCVRVRDRVGELKEGNHNSGGSSWDDHKIENAVEIPLHCTNDATALTITAVTG